MWVGEEIDIWDDELDLIFSSHISKSFFSDTVRLSIASAGVYFFMNMSPTKLINMDESMKGTMFLLNYSQLLLMFFHLLLIISGNLFMVFFSHRLEIFKGLKVDTVLRNFTVFEYTKDKVSVFVFCLTFCQCSRL